MDNGAGDRNALLLPRGELVSTRIDEFAHIEIIDDLFAPLLDLLRSQPVQRPEVSDTLPRRKPLIKVRCPRQITNALSHLFRFSEDMESGNGSRSGCRFEDRREHA